MSGKALWLQLPRYRKKPAKAAVKYIARRTKERARQERAYNKRVKVWLVGKVSRLSGKPATQCHHIRGRAGALLLDERGWVPVTAEDHDWIDRNRAKARALGLLCQKGDWGRPFEPRWDPEAGNTITDAKVVKLTPKQLTTIFSPENCLETAASMLKKVKP